MRTELVGVKCACGWRGARTPSTVDAAPCPKCGGGAFSRPSLRGRRKGDVDAPMSERLFRHVDRNGPTPAHVPQLGPCWVWTAHRAHNGYGRLRDERKRPRAAHVLSFMLAYGPVPDGKEIAHKCDNPACVRPTHLEAVTHAENLADMRRKGRAHYQKGVTCGEPRKDGRPCEIPTGTCRHHRRKEQAA
jgi:hypothetical protein